MCEYKNTFEKLEKYFKTEHFCKEQKCWGRNIPLDVEKKGMFIAMVGPPARGKSATYNIIQSYLEQFDRYAYLYNAGDFRRVWEDEVKKHFKSNVDAFISFCYKKQFAKKDTLEPHREDLLNWLTGKIKAIPGNVFSHFKDLNEEFARVCIREANKKVNAGEIIVLDATNTDIPRREYIINEFKKGRNKNKTLLFIENICFNEKQLKKNFSSKLTESGDYKTQVNQNCKKLVTPKRNIHEIIDSVTEHFNLLYLPCKTQNGNVNQCENTILDSMIDIVSRDMGYLKKYVPLHVSANGKWSTIYTIRRNKDKNIGFLQLLNHICLPENKRNSLFYSNIKHQDGNLIDFIVHADVTKEIKSSYGQKNRVFVTGHDLKHLLP